MYNCVNVYLYLFRLLPVLLLLRRLLLLPLVLCWRRRRRLHEGRFFEQAYYICMMLSRCIGGTPIINICTTYMLKKNYFYILVFFAVLKHRVAPHIWWRRKPCVFKVHTNGGDKLTSGFKFEQYEARVLGLCPSNDVDNRDNLYYWLVG